MSRLRRVVVFLVITILVGFVTTFGVATNIVVEAKTTTLTGENGTWEVETEGNEINIKFTADGTKVTCQRIVFIQIMKISIDGTVVSKHSILDRKFAHLHDDVTPGGWAVDHVRCETDPYYNGGDPQDSGQSGSAGSPVTPATMRDAPRISDWGFFTAAKGGVRGSKATIQFETAAVCADNDQFLGSIEWEYTRSKGDKDNGKSELTSTEVNEKPSEAFKGAISTFENNHWTTRVTIEIGEDGYPYTVVWEERYCPDE